MLNFVLAGMTYMRPASSQIDLWRSIGLDLDWSILFDASRRTEHFDPPSADLVRLGASFEASAHGFNGPLLTCVSQHMPTSQIHETFNETFKALGIPPRHEFCGGQLRGFGVQATAQDDTLDIREDAARAYYYPIMDRPNLVVLVNTTATRILWAPQDRSGADAVASGAEAVAKNGETVQIFANREVIVSAGAIRSPSILEQSGVGNPSVLAKQSIDVKISLPAVGENFQDQSVSIVTAQTAQVFTGFPVFVANIGLQDLLGSNASGFYNATKAKLASYAATIASQNGGASDASVQEYLLRTQLDLLMRSNTPVSELAPIALLDYIEIAFWPLQPFSRGSVHINSRNKTAPPALDAKYFQLDIDNHLMAATARFARKLLTTPPLSTIVNVSTITPSFTTVPEDASDAVWMDWINEKPNYGPNCHHLGTCTMLPKCFGGVVDNDYRVYGSANVRVVDLSVVPLQIAGHSTAPLYGIAELAAAKIKAHSRRHF